MPSMQFVFGGKQYLVLTPMGPQFKGQPISVETAWQLLRAWACNYPETEEPGESWAARINFKTALVGIDEIKDEANNLVEGKVLSVVHALHVTRDVATMYGRQVATGDEVRFVHRLMYNFRLLQKKNSQPPSAPDVEGNA